MIPTNYRDLSTTGNDLNAGFQFEFVCNCCSNTWKSPFKPYRMGQITGWLTRFAFLLTDLNKAGRGAGSFADAGSRGAKEEALREAQNMAASRYHRCESCRGFACDDCFNTREQSCKNCVDKARYGEARQEQEKVAAMRESGVSACPNCQTDTGGGRFCPECGFDMASTHKSCPGCGSMVKRQARFCTDCGHGF